MKAQSYVFLLGWANNTQIFSKRRLIFYTYLVCNLLIINIYILKSAEKIRTFTAEFQAVMQVTNNPAI